MKNDNIEDTNTLIPSTLKELESLYEEKKISIFLNIISEKITLEEVADFYQKNENEILKKLNIKQKGKSWKLRIYRDKNEFTKELLSITKKTGKLEKTLILGIVFLVLVELFSFNRFGIFLFCNIPLILKVLFSIVFLYVSFLGKLKNIIFGNKNIFKQWGKILVIIIFTIILWLPINVFNGYNYLITIPLLYFVGKSLYLFFDSPNNSFIITTARKWNFFKSNLIYWQVLMIVLFLIIISFFFRKATNSFDGFNESINRIINLFTDVTCKI